MIWRNRQTAVPKLFYRAIFDPARQNILDTLSTALHLPASPDKAKLETVPNPHRPERADLRVAAGGLERALATILS